MGDWGWGLITGLVVGMAVVLLVLPDSPSEMSTSAAIICPNAPPIQVKKYELVQGRIVFKFQGMKTIAPMTCGVVEVENE